MSSSSASPYTALTTTFTPDPNCTQNIGRTDFPICTDDEYCAFFYLGPTTFEPGCYPDGNPNISYYSPGVCPYGYPAACSFSDTVTTMTCCPNGYSCISDASSDIVSHPWDAFFICTTDMDHTQEVVFTTSVLGLGYVVSTVMAQSAIHAFGYIVEFAAGEIPTTLGPPSSSSATASPASASAAATSRPSGVSGNVPATGAASAPQDDTDNGGLLSLGGRAGLGVGVGVGGLLVLALLFWLVRRQRRRHAQMEEKQRQEQIFQQQQHMFIQQQQQQQQQQLLPPQYTPQCDSAATRAELASATDHDSAFSGTSPRVVSWLSRTGTATTADCQPRASRGPDIPPVVEAPA